MIGLFAAVAGNAWEGMSFRTWWIAFLVFVSHEGPTGNDARAACHRHGARRLDRDADQRDGGAAGARRAPPTDAHSRWPRFGAFALIPPLFGSASLWLSVVLTTLYLCIVFADAGTLAAAVLDETPPARRGVAMAASATVGNMAAFAGAACVGAMLGLAGGPASQSAWLDRLCDDGHRIGSRRIGALARSSRSVPAIA